MSKVIKSLFVFAISLIFVFLFVSCAPENEIKTNDGIVTIKGSSYETRYIDPIEISHFDSLCMTKRKVKLYGVGGEGTQIQRTDNVDGTITYTGKFESYVTADTLFSVDPDTVIIYLGMATSVHPIQESTSYSYSDSSPEPASVSSETKTALEIWNMYIDGDGTADDLMEKASLHQSTTGTDYCFEWALDKDDYSSIGIPFVNFSYKAEKSFTISIKPTSDFTRMVGGIAVSSEDIEIAMGKRTALAKHLLSDLTSTAAGQYGYIVSIIMTITEMFHSRDNMTDEGTVAGFYIPNNKASGETEEDGYWDDKYEGDTATPEGYTVHGQCATTSSDGNYLRIGTGYDGWLVMNRYFASPDPSGYLVEARVRVETSSGYSPFCIIIEDGNSDRVEYALIDENKVCWNIGTGSYNLDTSQYHVYRVVSRPTSPYFVLYVDGEKVLTSDGWDVGGDMSTVLRFGDYYTTKPSTLVAYVDYIYYHANYPFTPEDPTPDNTAPSVSITSPTGGTINGTKTCTVSASDSGGSGLNRVEYYIDGYSAGISTNSPYSWDWDTTLCSEGSHTLVARAYDNDRNYKDSSTKTVTVSNLGTECFDGSSFWWVGQSITLNSGYPNEATFTLVDMSYFPYQAMIQCNSEIYIFYDNEQKYVLNDTYTIGPVHCFGYSGGAFLYDTQIVPNQ